MNTKPTLMVAFVDCITCALGAVMLNLIIALTQSRDVATDLRRELDTQSTEIANVRAIRQERDALVKARNRLARQSENYEKQLALARAEKNKLGLNIARLATNLAAANLKNIQLSVRFKRHIGLKSELENVQAKVNELTRENEQLIAKQAGLKKLQQTQAREVVGLNGQFKHVAFVFDTSGSMEAGFAEYKELLSLWIRRLDLLHFNIISFADTANRWNPSWQEATEATRALAANYVESFTAGGQTATHAALLEALQLPDIDTIVLFSDGGPTDGEPDEILAEVQTANQHKVVINVVAIGNYFEQDYGTFLQNLAKQHGGVFLGR